MRLFFAVIGLDWNNEVDDGMNKEVDDKERILDGMDGSLITSTGLTVLTLFVLMDRTPKTSSSRSCKAFEAIKFFFISSSSSSSGGLTRCLEIISIAVIVGFLTVVVVVVVVDGNGD